MSRNRNNRRQRRSQAATLERRYASLWRDRAISRALESDDYYEKQSNFHKEMAKKEQDILSRAIYVQNVKDLRIESNFEGLERFFSTFGPVKRCIRAKSNGRRRSKTCFPSAKVVFSRRADAERLFGYKPLLGLNAREELDCLVGHRGKIFIRPCLPSSDLLAEETRGSRITLSISRLVLGHWCPVEQEMDPSAEDKNVWLGEQEERTTILVTIDMKDRRIKLTQQSDLLKTDYLSFRFKQLSCPMTLCRDDKGGYAIVFSAKCPPKIEYKMTFDSDEELKRSVQWGTLPQESLGSCLGYKLMITDEELRSLLLHEKADKLRDFGLLGFDFNDLQNPPVLDSNLIGCTHKIAFACSLTRFADFKLASLMTTLRDSGRVTEYHAQNEELSSNSIMEHLMSIQSPFESKRAQQILEKIQSGHGFTKFPLRLFRRLRESVLVFDLPPPPHCVSIPRMRISPLRTVCAGFETETSNRVLRYFTERENFDMDRFLRATMVDEDGGYLQGSDLEPALLSRLEDALVFGVTLGGRTYKFLAYSSSQLKEHSVWMVCPPSGWTVASMSAKLGSFENCKTIPKLGARIGQCFSTTFADSSVSGCGPSWTEVVDIEASKGCHSDGTGLIKRDALERLLCTLPIGPKESSQVSIVQVRFGGAKGTLTAYDNPMKYLPRGTQNADIFLRRSMIKFETEGEFHRLEICSIGKNVPYFLNRNVILLLSAHGVCDEVFLSMQKEMLDDLDSMLTDRKVALRLVPKLGGPENDQRAMLLHMLHAGLSPNEEPFLYDCLSAIRSHHIYVLRKKSRIFVQQGSVLVGGLDETGKLPEGCVFFVVGSHPYVGEVMVTKHPVMHPGDLRMLKAVDVPELRKHRNMILFSMHGERPEADKMSGSDLDGDEFAVTWDKRLFFHGNREAMEYSSPSQTENLNAAPSNPLEVSIALVSHFVNHMKNANLGQISMLWLDHAVSKDDKGHVKGADCCECVELAGLHSLAVDFPKQGIAAVIPKRLRLPASVQRAHWREKKNSPSFRCESIIGQLYNEVIRSERDTVHRHRQNANAALGSRRVDRYGTITCDLNKTAPSDTITSPYNRRILAALTAFPERDRWMATLQRYANQERARYENELLQIMNKYQIRGEGETYIGCIRKYHKLHKKRQHDFSQEVRRNIGEMRSMFRQAFFESVIKILNNPDELETFEEQMDLDGDEDDDDDHGDESANGSETGIDEERWKEVERQVIDSNEPKDSIQIRQVAFRLAAAYYNASYHPEHRWSNQDEQVALFSFPWLFADIISLALSLAS